jgi:hypothetical protein
MPPPPANLANNCPDIPGMPSPAIDPERAIWEVDLVALYGDCALRHRLAINAWEEAVKHANK